MTYDNYQERRKKFSPDELPKTIQRKIFIHYNMRGEIEIWDCDLSGKERVLLGEQMVNVKIPQQSDMKKKVVEALENEIEKIQADAHMQVKELREKIEQLLCIDYKPQPEPLEAVNDLPF